MLQDLAGSWAGHRAWTLLDACLLDGKQLVDICRLWRDDPARPALLHYVALATKSAALHPETLARTISELGLGNVERELNHLYAGFNRVLLAGGSISLTICVGDAADSLKALRVQADSVLLSAASAGWDDTHWAQLALNCRSGATLYPDSKHFLHAQDISRHGFLKPAAQDKQLAQFLPRWRPKTSRRLVSAPVSPRRCAVIGSGLSGAATARALALRGWEVSVYDASPTPAGGSSGLPVGLCVPLQSADGNPLSHLSLQGVRLTLAHAKHHLQEGHDWKPAGVLEQRDTEQGKADVFHSHAGWIKPAALVHAWLQHPSIHWTGGFEVTALQRRDQCWRLTGAQNDQHAEADMVVFANAYGCRKLLEQLADTCNLGVGVRQKMSALHAVHGTLSMGPDDSTAESGPRNGSGSWIGKVPASDHYFWAAGATYEPMGHELASVTERHAENLRKLRILSGQHARTVQTALDGGAVRHWSGTRCVTHDRLPLVGPLEQAGVPSLWICAGMGSRGISLAALCAELLAAYIGSEPLPLPARLAHCLSVMRPTRGTIADAAKA